MMPQAMLHPTAPINMARMSSRPASAMLSEPVKVSTMIRPKSTSAMRSLGSRTRTGRDSFDIAETGAGSLGRGRQEVERHREDHVYHQQEDPDEPGRTAAARDQGDGARGDEDHHHGAGPEAEVH